MAWKVEDCRSPHKVGYPAIEPGARFRISGLARGEEEATPDQGVDCHAYFRGRTSEYRCDDFLSRRVDGVCVAAVLVSSQAGL